MDLSVWSFGPYPTVPLDRKELDLEHPRADRFLLVSIDSWRYDALGRTNPELNTPKFDHLTRDYGLAERFFVTAPATRPSHTSLFTGLYPFEHGLFGQTYLRMFGGIPNLFQLLSEDGYAVTARSERPEVFRFLDFEPFIRPFDPTADHQHLGSLEQLIAALREPETGPRFCFLHFWYTHGGYGMGGIPGAPVLKELVSDGRAEEALRFYYAATTHVLEFVLVEILKQLSLDRWAIFIFGDHGEGFCPEVMSHGDCLHENVVRVPLLAHVPSLGGVNFPPGPSSMIDLYPTIARLAGLPLDYEGYGRDLLAPSPTAKSKRWVLTELDSLYGVGFLHPGNLQTAHQRVTSRIAIDDAELARAKGGTRMWSISDGREFYRQQERSGEFVLRNVVTGQPLPCPDPDLYRNAYRDILHGSRYRDQQVQESSSAEERVLEERLRDLGYIE